jgi:DNA-binding NarL/FixJ family response regulator
MNKSLADLSGGNTQLRFIQLYKLTPREVEVLELLCIGKTNDQLTTELSVCKKTIEHHLSRLYSKLNVRSRLEATICAMRNGFVAEN